MTDSQKIELRISAVQQRLREIAQLEGDTYSEEVQIENRELQKEFWPARRTEAGQPDC